MPSKLSEDDIDDLLYFARIGDSQEFNSLGKDICARDEFTIVELVQSAREEASGNGVLHMAAANGHHGK